MNWEKRVRKSFLVSENKILWQWRVKILLSASNYQQNLISMSIYKKKLIDSLFLHRTFTHKLTRKRLHEQKKIIFNSVPSWQTSKWGEKKGKNILFHSFHAGFQGKVEWTRVLCTLEWAGWGWKISSTFILSPVRRRRLFVYICIKVLCMCECVYATERTEFLAQHNQH